MIYIILTIQIILESLIIIVSATCVVAIIIFVEDQCENWRRKKREQQEWDNMIKEITQQRQQREKIKQREVERKKYPLFYLKEGIV